MKGVRISLSILVLSAAVSMAQEQRVESGTPAVLESVTGKKARVFLKKLDNGVLTFQAYQASRNVSVSAAKIKSLTFHVDWDASAMGEMYNAGQYDELVASLETRLKPYLPFMTVENNLREFFVMLVESYRKAGNYDRVRALAGMLTGSNDPGLVQRGYVNLALVAIAENELEKAAELMDVVSSEAAKLYLQASIERAEGRPKDAIRTASGIIINHANDLEWLGPSELLCAHLYMDMLKEPDSVITTNSPLHTARQVKNIYSGTSVAADGRVLWASLGGEAIEAAELARKEELKRQEAEERAQREAERAVLNAAELAEDAADESGGTNAPDADATATNVTTTTEMESE